MEKTGIIIIGPESSGTKLLTRLFMEQGYSGDDTDNQSYDTVNPTYKKVVWRRSLPHGKIWYNVPDLVRKLDCLEYNVKVVGIIREMSATCQSQIRHGHVRDMEEAMRNYKQSLLYLKDVDYMLTYESLVLSPNTSMQRMFNMLNLGKVGKIWITIDDKNKSYK